MNFHVADRGGGGGVAINLASQKGSCLNCSNKIINIFPRLLSFYKLNPNQAT